MGVLLLGWLLGNNVELGLNVRVQRGLGKGVEKGAGLGTMVGYRVGIYMGILDLSFWDLPLPRGIGEE